MIGLILMLALLGLIVWAVITFIPMPQPLKTVIVAVVVIAAIIYVLGAFGFGDIAIPRIHH